ncbi:esterase family protein [Prescottella equi]|uniref:alpha/beta hydrolase n=1 Tax=Rhodococcus hoagii TaxID=43767 RepID=UPI000A1073C9|nr:alpha/beta hydrolase family protein [Prescottella equi]ORL92595.1 mycolyltransferase [Prescottella equi]ORM11141.1 mycolyltransferase [Prescottella equi]QDP08920.1 esterase family protein [Prescottella equi]
MRVGVRKWRGARAGSVVGLGAAAMALVFSAGTATAAPSEGSASGSLGSGSLGSLGSLTGSSGAGSVSSGSSIPESLQEDPGPPPAVRDDITTAAIVGEKPLSNQAVQLTIASPALRREVTVQVLLPADRSAPRPTLYMLDGVSARNNGSGWMSAGLGDAPGFFADKDVNVVLINGGRASLYTDWDEIDPKLGLNRWETYLTQELPGLIDAKLKTNGVNAIAGNSMGAQSAVMLAHRHPELYRGVAAFSGCYSTSDPLGRLVLQTTVTSQGGDPTNMWSDPDGPEWLSHDSVRNAEQLRGKPIYLSVSNGLPGEFEEGSDDARRLYLGGAIEAATNVCTRIFQARLEQLDIPVTVDYAGAGVHAWDYWRLQLPKSWPTLAKALGLS